MHFAIPICSPLPTAIQPLAFCVTPLLGCDVGSAATDIFLAFSYKGDISVPSFYSDSDYPMDSYVGRSVNGFLGGRGVSLSVEEVDDPLPRANAFLC
jgi:hypothetical protein